MWTLPFSLIIFLMFFNRFDSSLEDAALTLGATRWQTFRNVTLPVMQPAVLTSLLFAFTLSLDEFQRSLLITGTEQTLPLMVMASVTTRVTPTLYALGTLTTLLSFVVVAIYLLLLTSSQRRSERLMAGSARPAMA
jgi:putative spermidine/putrescine transport system permease protein